MKKLKDLAKEYREFSAYEPSETVYSDKTELVDRFGNLMVSSETLEQYTTYGL